MQIISHPKLPGQALLGQFPTSKRLLGDEIPQAKDHDAPRGRWNRGVHGHLRRQRPVLARLHGQGAAGVEAVPAEPQRKGAQP